MLPSPYVIVSGLSLEVFSSGSPFALAGFSPGLVARVPAQILGRRKVRYIFVWLARRVWRPRLDWNQVASYAQGSSWAGAVSDQNEQLSC